MKKLMAIIVTAVMITGVLSGCAEKEPAPVESTATPIPSETVQPEPTADEQALPTEPPVVTPEPEKALTEIKSDYGYAISYEEDSFDYRRIEGYDEFALKTDAIDKPSVFVSISLVGEEFVEQMITAGLGEHPETCTIGQSQTQAQYSETKEAWDGGELLRRTYVCLLDSGDALLIVTQWYTEQTEDAYATLLFEMVNSIVV